MIASKIMRGSLECVAMILEALPRNHHLFLLISWVMLQRDATGVFCHNPEIGYIANSGSGCDSRGVVCMYMFSIVSWAMPIGMFTLFNTILKDGVGCPCAFRMHICLANKLKTVFCLRTATAGTNCVVSVLIRGRMWRGCPDSVMMTTGNIHVI